MLNILKIPFLILINKVYESQTLFLGIAAEMKPSKDHAGATLEVPSEELLRKSTWGETIDADFLLDNCFNFQSFAWLISILLLPREELGIFFCFLSLVHFISIFICARLNVLCCLILALELLKVPTFYLFIHFDGYLDRESWTQKSNFGLKLF